MNADNPSSDPAAILDAIVQAQHQGLARGICSICSAHEAVIEAGLRYAGQIGMPVLVESTCNQVNQFGGYTGMTPAGFARTLQGIARRVDLPPGLLVLGGDHLGPNVWQGEPAESAMQKSCHLVRDCVLAGYTKLHLDASMRCADDPPGALAPATVACRTAELAAAAEEALAQRPAGSPSLRYVVGTEVPAPGGIQAGEDELPATPAERVAETIELTRRAFESKGLGAAWERVRGVVVQPGVEYGVQGIVDYRPQHARELSQFIEGFESLVYEAHSTDYQTRQTLRRLVADHFGILKVGPALTFAYREAVFALALIEEEMPAGQGTGAASGVRRALEEAMLAEPHYWESYYTGTPAEQRFARQFSFSDRSRYYWPIPAIRLALERLMANLGEGPLPLPLLSQYLPVQYARIRAGSLANTPRDLIRDRVMDVVADYAYACGYTARDGEGDSTRPEESGALQADRAAR